MSDAVGEFYDANTGVLTASIGMLGFVCRRTGQVATTTKLNGRGTYNSLITIDVSGYSVPIVAVRCEGYSAALMGRSTQVAGRLQYISDAPVGTVFTYYIFDYTQALPEHDSEFMLRNPNTNAITFSNRFWPMKLVGGLDISETSGSRTYNAIQGTALAHSQSNIGGHSRTAEAFCYDGGVSNDGAGPGCKDVRGVNDGKLYGAFTNGSQLTTVKLSFDDVRVSYGTYEQYTQQYGAGWSVPTLILIIDVTNIPVGVTFF